MVGNLTLKPRRRLSLKVTDDGQEPLAHIGYARLSITDPDTALQLGALAATGCSKVFENRASGIQLDRASLHQALDHVRAVDVLVT